MAELQVCVNESAVGELYREGKKTTWLHSRNHTCNNRYPKHIELNLNFIQIATQCK